MYVQLPTRRGINRERAPSVVMNLSFIVRQNTMLLTGTIKASDNSELSTTGWETRVELIMQLRCNINRPIRVGVCNVRLTKEASRVVSALGGW